MLEDKHMNRDPITDEPGAHPVGTGIGTAGGALAGMAAGAMGGPITMAVGGLAGAVTGGLAGKAVAESVNPTTDDAWDRLSDSAWSGPRQSDDTIDTLNDLIETCRDGEYGFAACAEHCQSPSLKTLLLKREAECGDAAQELQNLVLRLDGRPESGGTTTGAMHRGWVAVRGTLSGYTDKSMLDECERGEDVALAAYRKALKHTLPADIRTVVERQQQGAQRNHDQIKALRDEARRRA